MFGRSHEKANELAVLVVGVAERLSGSDGAPLVLTLRAAVTYDVVTFPA